MSGEDHTSIVDADGGLLSLETWDRLKHSEPFVAVTAVLFVLLFSWLITDAPLIAGLVDGSHSLARDALPLMILALSFNLLLGQTGLLSFGHAMFWGGAGYAAALFAIYVSGSPLLIVASGVLFAVVLGFLAALVLLRLHGVYFAIVTLAIAQTLYRLVREPLEPLTQGINGLSPQFDPLVGVFGFGEFTGPLAFLGSGKYLFVGVFFVATVVLITRIRKSPYGLIFKALQENETRTRFVGLDVWRYKFAAFMISAAIAGLAGALFLLADGSGAQSGYISPGRLYWDMSGNLVVMVVLGGLGTIVGPLIGVFFYEWMGNYFNGLDLIIPGLEVLGSIGSYWQLIIALVFTAVVWAYPSGIWGMITDVTGALREPRTIPGKARRKLPGQGADGDDGGED